MKTTLVAATLIAVAAPPTFALAAPPTSASAVLDITETDAKGKATTSKVETVITLDRGQTHVESFDDGARTAIDLSWHSDKGAAAPILDIDLGQERERRKTRFAVRARIATGKRAVLTDVTRSDGSRFTLAVTLK
ncbi:MAG TPA: hypothetical protein VIG06_00280 [Kofleriaceae bacterium]|jgi:hypothetical protein